MIAQPLLNQVLALSVAERYELIDAIEHSVAPTSDELDALLAVEAEDRIAAYEQGEIKAVDGPTALAHIRSLLAR